MYLNKQNIVSRFLLTLSVFLFFLLSLNIVFQPSHDRNWEIGQEKLPYISFDDKTGDFSIKNFRNFDWFDTGVANIRYETRNFNINSMNSVDVYISHFSEFEGLAHIFLSFGFEDGRHIVVSFETRREVGEKFSPILGILRQFEIIYVVGSERDVVGLRTDVRGERVYLYHTKATPKQARDFFRKISLDINSIYKKPRIYNTLTHNCTNELTRRAEEVSNIDFPITWKSIMPGYFDEVLYKLNIIDTAKNFRETKKDHLIDNNSVNHNSPTFEQDLRK